MDIKAEQLPNGEWRALDLDEYEGECDSTGWWSTSLVGYGKTEQEAIDDLFAEREERASAPQMNIRRMIPMGSQLRKCAVCGAQITARRDDDYPTDHEWECLRKLLVKKALAPEQDK